jgi:hypothetical protein
MSRLTRLGAGLLAAAALAAPARAAEINPILPPETEAVFSVNMRQILDANLVKKFVLGQAKQMLAGNDAAKELKELGLDPLKDIDSLTGGTWGKGDDGNVVFVVKGRFDLDKMFAAAEARAKAEGDKVKIVSEGKYKLVQLTLDNVPKPVLVTFADDKTIVGSFDKKQAVAAADLAKAGGNKPQLKKDLAALVLKQDEKASLYMCGLVDKFDGLPPGVGGGIPGVDAAKLGEQLKSLRSVAMTLKLTEDVALDVDMGMADTESATEFGGTLSQLVGTAKGFLPLVAGQNPNAKPLADEVANTLKSSVKEKEVSLTLKLSGDAIGKAAGGGD